MWVACAIFSLGGVQAKCGDTATQKGSKIEPRRESYPIRLDPIAPMDGWRYGLSWQKLRVVGLACLDCVKVVASSMGTFIDRLVWFSWSVLFRSGYSSLIQTRRSICRSETAAAAKSDYAGCVVRVAEGGGDQPAKLDIRLQMIGTWLVARPAWPQNSPSQRK